MELRAFEGGSNFFALLGVANLFKTDAARLASFIPVDDQLNVIPGLNPAAAPDCLSNGSSSPGPDPGS